MIMMTTNVFSLLPHSMIMACDSRWSYETENFIYYIDDSGFDKIIYNHNMVAVFAGNAKVIDQFKIWINNNLVSEMPRPDGISIIAYNFKRQTYFARNHTFEYPSKENAEALFSGSGSADAMKSWIKHKSCIRSIQDACLTDLYTGGSIKYFDIVSKMHNISDIQLPFLALFQTLKQEGFVIRKNPIQLTTTMAEPIQSAIQDIEVANDLNALANGEASLDAPAPEALIPWNKEEISALSDFFKTCQ